MLQVNNLSGFSTNTTILTKPTASVLYPNQPAGFTRFFELNYSDTVPGLSLVSSSLAGAWGAFQDTGSHVSRSLDSTAPQSPPFVLQFDFETNTAPGNDTADASVREWFGWDSNSLNTYSQIYESTRFKIISTTSGAGTGFETQEVGVKLFGYWGVGETNNGSNVPTQLYNLIRGNGSSTAVLTSWNLDMLQQDVVSRNLPQNLNTGTKITVGVWHQLEIYMKLNSTTSSTDGIWEWWVDGVPFGSYTDVQFNTAANPNGFWGRQFDPVWGGGGGTNKTRTDYLWLDHTYISGKI